MIDVYRKNVPVQKNPLHIALYITMFPQLVAGPIVRYEDIYEKIVDRDTRTEELVQGTGRFIIGLAKKVMIADILAKTADQIFSLTTDQLTPAVAWLGAICYTFQIFFDFSGYSDMAIGLGRVFGFRFPENFNLPYISSSVTEFWRRWHISLSSWFRDYLYIPMGGNRRGNVYLHLLMVFFCTGLWHGAAFTFVVWGLWHGMFLIIERMNRDRTPKIPACVRRLYTMLVVLIGWVIFRSSGISYALGYIRVMAGSCTPVFRNYSIQYYLDGQIVATLAAALLVGIGIPKQISLYLQRYGDFGYVFGWMKAPALWILLFLSMCMIINGNYSPFIYFRF